MTRWTSKSTHDVFVGVHVEVVAEFGGALEEADEVWKQRVSCEMYSDGS